MPERTLRRGTRGLEKKGIIETKEVRLSREHSRLEYRLAYDRVIGCDPGYPKSRDRGPVKGIQMMLMSPASPCPPTGQLLPPYRPPLAGLPATDGRQSSLGSSSGSPIEEKKDSLSLKEEERKGTPEEERVRETKAERSDDNRRWIRGRGKSR